MSDEPKPATPLSREQLLEKALRLLARRDYSVAQLRARLQLRARALEDLDWVLDRLHAASFLDDRAVADRRSERAREQLLGRRRAEQDLRELQVDESVAAGAVARHYAAVDEDAMALKHLEEKLRSLLEPPGKLEDQKALQRAYGRLRRAGFGHGPVVYALRHYSRLAADLDDVGPDDNAGDL